MPIVSTLVIGHSLSWLLYSLDRLSSMWDLFALCFEHFLIFWHCKMSRLILHISCPHSRTIFCCCNSDVTWIVLRGWGGRDCCYAVIITKIEVATVSALRAYRKVVLTCWSFQLCQFIATCSAPSPQSYARAGDCVPSFISMVMEI